MKKLFIAIDNGVTGSIGVIGPKTTEFFKTPVFSQKSYTKVAKNISRINTKHLKEAIITIIDKNGIENLQEVAVCLERPMINPAKFVSSISAARSLEATLIVLEDLGISFQYIDSKAWQKLLLPSGVIGSKDLKKASKDIGDRLFPEFKDIKHEDRDGILMAEYLRRQYK